MAAALSVPLTAQGENFPHRDEILVLTFVVVGFTLLVQGATLPLVIRWANLSGSDLEEQAAVGRALDRLVAVRDSYVQQAADQGQAPEPVLAALRRETGLTRSELDEEGRTELFRMRRDVTRFKRQALAAMVERADLEDTQMWQLQQRLDLDEALLAMDETLHRQLPASSTAPGQTFTPSKN